MATSASLSALDLTAPLEGFESGLCKILMDNATPVYTVISDYNTANNIKALYLREQRFTATASQTAFALTSYTPVAAATDKLPIRVYRNGARLTWVSSGPAAGQFTYSGATVTTSSSSADDIIVVEYIN